MIADATRNTQPGAIAMVDEQKNDARKTAADQLVHVARWMQANGHEDEWLHVSPQYNGVPHASALSMLAFRKLFAGRQVTKQLLHGMWDYKLVLDGIEFGCTEFHERDVASGEPQQVTL
jgi:hypothetical protein